MARAVLRIAAPYDEATVRSVEEGFAGLLGKKPDFQIVEDPSLLGGFVAMIGGKVYDASYSSLLVDAGKKLRGPDGLTAGSSFSAVGSDLQQRLRETKLEPTVYEVGEVASCHDDIVQIKGLSHCQYGELLEFDGGAVGLTLDLSADGAGAALLNGTVSPAGIARRTGRVAEVIVGEGLLGRVIDPLGRPLDNKGDIRASKTRRLESPAPSIMDRAPVDTALETGILAIDSMIPIGRGQRELIIGDRQTGKTSIALSAIINQRGRDVLCVYCAIGQKASTVSGLVHTLSAAGAMEYTVIVSADSSVSAAMQYIAPYAACAIAEEFMYGGKDVLVVYDDLSKHAVAYRTMSLLLRRPSGREAYPGDVFYLHSRLLERSARLSPALGGGSMTALPIVETLAGDISAYIPTNVISITDGQIYLESELFHAGMRPAVNVGLSVSRVGSAAQHKAMRDVSGSLRLEVAQYREMAVFAQFGADLDAATFSMLKNGEKLMELLKQKQDRLYSLSEQTAILLAAANQVFKDTDKHAIDDTRTKLLSYLRESAASVMNRIDSTGLLTDEDRADLLRAFRRFAQRNGGAA